MFLPVVPVLVHILVLVLFLVLVLVLVQIFTFGVCFTSGHILGFRPGFNSGSGPSFGAGPCPCPYY